MRRMMSGCLSEGQEGGEGTLSISNTTHRISNVAKQLKALDEKAIEEMVEGLGFFV